MLLGTTPKDRMGSRSLWRVALLGLLLWGCDEDEQMLGFKTLNASASVPKETPEGDAAPKPVKLSHTPKDSASARPPFGSTAPSAVETSRRPASLADASTEPGAATSDLPDAAAIGTGAGGGEDSAALAASTPSKVGNSQLARPRPLDATVEPKCEVNAGFNNGQECSAKVACSDHESTASCRQRDANGWSCEALLTQFDAASVPADAHRGQGVYLLRDVPEGDDACSIIAALFDEGSPWDPSIGEHCNEEASSSSDGCHLAPGCWHSLERESGQVDVWEAIQPDIDCATLPESSGGSTLCHCTNLADEQNEYELSNVEPELACVVLQGVCANDTSVGFTGAETCTTEARTVEESYCSDAVA
jgi:hypothetical protein